MSLYSFHIAWYATGLRNDDLAAALEQVASIAPRYGAKQWSVYRSAEDRYKFIQIVDFPNKEDFQQYWYGPEAREMRAAMSGAFQNPVTYVPHEVVTTGSQVVAEV